jgi:hypothetical protein
VYKLVKIESAQIDNWIDFCKLQRDLDAINWMQGCYAISPRVPADYAPRADMNKAANWSGLAQQGGLMAKRIKLPMIVMGRSMAGDPSTEQDPKVTFALEAETGEIFEVSFSLRGILSTVVMAHNWTPLREELAQVEPPIKV